MTPTCFFLHTYNCTIDSMSSILYVYFLYSTLFMLDIFHVFFFHTYQDTSECFELYVIYLDRCEHTQYVIDVLMFEISNTCIQF